MLFVADEVITGFGRTGRWFGLEHYGIEPDIMQFAKGITSGYVPLGGIGVSDAIREVINGVPGSKRWMHAYTYSGHPTCCAVALSNIDIIEQERLVTRAANGGARLLEKLRGLMGGRFEQIRDHLPELLDRYGSLRDPDELKRALASWRRRRTPTHPSKEHA